MTRHAWPSHGVALCAALALAGSAIAGPAEVRLRVEGRSATLFEGTVTTDARFVDGGDGSGAHRCGSSSPAPITALADAGLDWRGRWNPDFQDFFLDRIGADASDDGSASYWAVLADWRYAVGGCRTALAGESEVLWAYGADNRPLTLRLAGPARAEVGETVTLTVRDGRIRPSTGADGGPVAGALVGGVATDSDGRARLRYDSAGLRVLKAEHPDGIRSNALALCVGDAACEGGAPPPGEPPPRATIGKIQPGERFARGAGPRILRGTAPGASVMLGLSSRTARECRRCPAEPFTLQVRGGAWSHRLAGELPPGRYRLALASGSALSFRIAAHPHSRADAIRAATRYLLRARTRSPLMTGWTAIALARTSAGTRTARALRVKRRRLRSPGLRPRSLADLERTALALPGSRRLRTAIARRQRGDGSFGGDVNLTAFAVLALGRRFAARQDRARRWLLDHQLADGGFGLSAARADVDTTGAALWALGKTLHTRAARRAAAFLRSAQTPSGGTAALPGGEANAQSTALAAIGLRAAGLRPGRMRTEDGIDPLDYLRARVNSDGSVACDTGSTRSPVWVTAQALLALDSARWRE